MKKQSRRVNGILLLDKPTGISSNAALQQAKRLFCAKKAGHTGSLDPLASGMLPLCFGEATKFSQFLLEADKTYQVSAKLGVKTATSDAEGEVLSTRPVPTMTLQELDAAFESFRGEIDQVPSMYSALKYQGQPLYKLARQGITVERPSRRVRIYELTLFDYSDEMLHFSVKCSKGTYVRTLVDDFGESLSCGAYITALRRLSVGPYSQENMVTLAQLEPLLESHEPKDLDHYLLPIDTTIADWPTLSISPELARYLRQGQSVIVPSAPSSGWVRLTDKQGGFLGVGEITSGGKVAPKRMLTQ